MDTGDIQLNSISASVNGIVEELPFAHLECLPNEYFQFSENSEYDNDSMLFDDIQMEHNNIYGNPMIYYVTTFDTSYDKLFGEDNNRVIIRKFPVKASFELPKEEENYSTFGIEGLDNFRMYISKKHFEYFSKYDGDSEATMYPVYSGNKISAFDSTRPKVGDIIQSEHNTMYYEIIDVGEEEEMFLQRKHSWTLTVRQLKNEHLSLSASTSATMTDIYNEVLNKEDITRLNDYISSADDNVLYTSSVGEELDTTNPLNGW